MVNSGELIGDVCCMMIIGMFVLCVVFMVVLMLVIVCCGFGYLIGRLLVKYLFCILMMIRVCFGVWFVVMVDFLRLVGLGICVSLWIVFLWMVIFFDSGLEDVY